MVGATEGLQREDMEESRLGVHMADGMLCTVEHRLHVYIASHHTYLLGGEVGRSELLFPNFSLPCSEVVYSKQ